MNYRKFLIRFFTFIGGLYFFLCFVLPERIGASTDPNQPGSLIGGFMFGRYREQVLDGFQLIAAIAVGLGIVNLLREHVARLVFKRKNWSYSLALLVGLGVMLAAALGDWLASEKIALQAQKLTALRDFSLRIEEDYQGRIAGVKPWFERNRLLQAALESELTAAQEKIVTGAQALALGELKRQELANSARSLEEEFAQLRVLSLGLPNASDAAPDFSKNKELAKLLGETALHERVVLTGIFEGSQQKRFYEFLNSGLFAPLGAAMFALLGFYIAAAAYRAFRVKSPEAALMLFAALVVMLGQIPFGIWLWDSFPAVRLWLLQVPSAGAARAIEMGAAVAGVVMAFRMWLSIESENFE